MSKPTTRQAFIYRAAVKSGSDDTRTRDKKDNMYEMLFSMANYIKNMNRRNEEVRDIFRSLRKEYDMDSVQQTVSVFSWNAVARSSSKLVSLSMI
jgi:hypothetical protein